MIPSLIYLDGFDRENVEAVESEDEDEEGWFYLFCGSS